MLCALMVKKKFCDVVLYCCGGVSVTHLDAGQRCQLSKVGSTSENFVGSVSGCLPVVCSSSQLLTILLLCSLFFFIFFYYQSNYNYYIVLLICYLNTMDHCCFYCAKPCQEICNDCQIYAFCSPEHKEYHQVNNTCLPFKVHYIHK